MTPKDLFLQVTEILHSGYSSSNQRVLTEDEPLATCKEVKLNYNGQIAIYKFDQHVSGTRQLFPFFKNQSGKAQAMCDYVVFMPKENKLHVILCNLKSKNLSNSHDQVQAGYLFSIFLVETAARCVGSAHCPDFVEFRAIHFTNAKLKRPTIRAKPQPLDRYENSLRYTYRPCSEVCSLDIICRME